MSVQAAVEFMEKLHGDESLYAAVKSVPKGDVDALRELAAARGFDFDGDDFETAVARVSGTLSEEELGEVAGGLQLNTAFHKYSFSVPLVLKSFTKSESCGTGSCGCGEIGA